MEHNILTLDFWQDNITYEGHTMPTGTLACDALNIPDSVIEQLTILCEPLNRFMNNGNFHAKYLSQASEAALQIMELLRAIPPFTYLDIDYYADGIKKAFTKEGIKHYQAYNFALLTNSVTPEIMEKHKTGILLGRLCPVLAQLGYSLGEYKKALLPFAEALGRPDADRSIDGLAALFGQAFPPDTDMFAESFWMSLTNTSVQYISSKHPERNTPILVKRMHYVSFVGMLRSDWFEGLRVGHAPKKCAVCGRWFLTTNARHTKYCGGYAPEDEQHRSCRQIGAKLGRTHREKADDHPLRQIYERRCNTINRSVQRGTLDKHTANRMKKLAKDKQYRAISDVTYAQTRYAQEMEQDALFAEARK